MIETVPTAIRRLSEQLHGRMSLPGGTRYAAATATWAKTNRVPRAVVHCETTSDVQSAIRVARESDIPLSVRGGGHDWAGRALCDGIVLDLRNMNSVAVEPGHRIARTAGGARAADIVAVTDPLGVAPVAGSAGSVGYAGLTLGGGYGALIRRFGLALDNLVAAELVLADGRIVVASNNDNEELFWAIRGGGGNFGVVTALHHRLHDVPTVRSGLLLYPFSEARSVLGRCAEFVESSPEELGVQLGVAGGPDGRPVVLIAPTWSGAPSQGKPWTGPFLEMGTVLASTLEERTYGNSLTIFDPFVASGRRVVIDTCWVPSLDSRVMELFIEAIDDAPSPGCAMLTHEFNGAASRVPTDATAFGLRQDHVLVEIIAMWDETDHEDEEQRHDAWVQRTLRSFTAIALPGGYPNLLPRGDTERAAQSYGPNLERLMRAKRQYDPDNVFSSAIPLPGS